MQDTLTGRAVFTFAHDYRAFVAALNHGERCEIDEAMFVHWLEAAEPVCMRRNVVLADHREVRADFVAQSIYRDGRFQAFWHQLETSNPSDRRYFAQLADYLA
jgi:hypothetical protein